VLFYHGAFNCRAQALGEMKGGTQGNENRECLAPLNVGALLSGQAATPVENRHALDPASKHLRRYDDWAKILSNKHSSVFSPMVGGSTDLV
jgi:hypothetical protein